ncbi:MAG: 3-isopropylmalate dehydratase small subunit [Thermoplasmata archaeon]|nr:MAG: 3-isopropylmalate dehydratase small subunit [Thermoplasmata archaeon]KAA0015039.1 MAG: 3-isopropylmalate dehydratase small subunit [Thermoplasmata archaeon]
MKLEGRAWKFGDNIDTDQIFPGAYLTLTDVEEMGKHAMEGVPGREDFAKKVNKGDIIVAGKNFGCGSSREQAPIAIKGCGVSMVIAKSFARIFYRNAVNIGLPIMECADVDKIEDGDVLEVDLESGEIKVVSKDLILKGSPVTSLEFEIMKAGGLIPYLKSKEG